MLSFVLEYALWVPILAVTLAIATIAKRGLKSHASLWSSPSTVAAATVVLHVAYYTLQVGGDHFEYRIFAYLIPLTFIVLVWALNVMNIRPIVSIATSAGFLLLSMPVQWSHWGLTKDLNTRTETHVMRVHIAPHWHWAVKWYASAFDELQDWLIPRHVCMRHQEHKVFWKTQLSENVTRIIGSQLSGEDYPVFATWTVGVPSWVLPHVNIIDALGLNDYLIAHSPIPIQHDRVMAHSRRPPVGYIESYEPNVRMMHGEVHLQERTKKMTRDSIVQLESYWRSLLPDR